MKYVFIKKPSSFLKGFLVAGTGLTRFARWTLNGILPNKPDLILKSISFFVL